MNLNFYKYQGAGNDFVLIDNRDDTITSIDKEQVNLICDRRFGIGADGLMLLNAHADYDFEMKYYNADGNLGSMCGNGGRCIVAFAKHLGMIQHETTFLAVDGPHYAKIADKGDWVNLQMIDVETITQIEDAYILNTGSPHYVILQSNLDSFDVYTAGKKIRNSAQFVSKGINVNFVEKRADGYFVRTYERGVEDETFACGTGVTAVALAMAKLKNQLGEQTTKIKALGGELEIKFSYDGEKFERVFLCGPAKAVFQGQFVI
ncbi:diaminopimelate epimerase [Pedobacter sp. UYP30]|uniref:diaminopimelate epimerase n=1 Tax=Pedobacter sp. UYP30 TaxID=1756400 RepID=UPI00339B1499